MAEEAKAAFGVLPLTCASEFLEIYRGNGDSSPLPPQLNAQLAELQRRAERILLRVREAFPTFREGKPVPIVWTTDFIVEHLLQLFQLVGEPRVRLPDRKEPWVLRPPEHCCTNSNCPGRDADVGVALNFALEARKGNGASSQQTRAEGCNARVLCVDSAREASILFGVCPSCAFEYRFDMVIEPPSRAARLIGVCMPTRRCARPYPAQC